MLKLKGVKKIWSTNFLILKLKFMFLLYYRNTYEIEKKANEPKAQLVIE